MGKLKTLERFLRTYDLMLKGVLILLWGLWAVQIHVPIVKVVKDEVAREKQRNPVTEEEARRKGLELISWKVFEAKQKGPRYSPEDYFAALESLYENKADQVAFAYPMMSQMQAVLTENIRQGYFTHEDLEKAREPLEKKFPAGRRGDGESTPLSWPTVLTWFQLFYLRSMFLVLLFYLVRMSEDKGILGTILAEKWKFVLATLGWMFYFHRYPSNVLREIRVEAELRRIGKVFRRFSSRERLEIRRIANSAEFHLWLAQFRCSHERRFQRALLLAVLATIALRCLQPMNAYADLLVSSGNSPPVYSVDFHSADGHDECEERMLKGVLSQTPPPELRLPLQGIKRFFDAAYRSMFIGKIEHIPLFRLFGGIVHEQVTTIK